MPEDKIGDQCIGEVVFPRLGFKSLKHATIGERRFLQLLKYSRPPIGDLLPRAVSINMASLGSTGRLAADYIVVRGDGSRELVTINQKCRGRGRRCAEVSDAESKATAAALTGFRYHILDENDLGWSPQLRRAAFIEAHGAASLPNDWLLAGYVALYGTAPRRVRDLAAAMPAGIDALTVALRLAWLGEILFASGPVDVGKDSAFVHTPVRATFRTAVAT